MFARLIFFIGSLAFSSAAMATTVDCRQSTTFLRTMPGGQEVVFHCGCEPPPLSGPANEETACVYPAGARPENYSVIPTFYPQSGAADIATQFGTVAPGVPFAPRLRPAAMSSPSARPCVGECYGVISPRTGNARDTPVGGYTRKDGTSVRPYTRSHTSRSGQSGSRR